MKQIGVSPVMEVLNFTIACAFPLNNQLNLDDNLADEPSYISIISIADCISPVYLAIKSINANK